MILEHITQIYLEEAMECFNDTELFSDVVDLEEVAAVVAS